MRENNENATWKDTEEEIAGKIKELTTSHLAVELLKQEHDKSRAKNVGVISLTVAVIVIAIGMAVINYRNDCDWRQMFSDYDFISQDGEGINNVNGGEQGDLNNGATSEAEEE